MRQNQNESKKAKKRTPAKGKHEKTTNKLRYAAMDARRRKKENGFKKADERKKAPKPAKKAKSSGGSYTILKAFLFLDLIVILALVFGYYNSPITALPFDGWEHVPLTGVFAPNEKLTNGVKIPNLHAPESIAVDDKGNLYAGLHDGRIVKVHPSSDGGVGLGTIETITTGVFPGYETTDGSSHGRPMGIRLRKDALYVMDSVYGLYTIDLKSKDRPITHLIKPSDVKPAMMFPNDVDVTADGKIAYFTDSSIKYTLKDVADIGLLDGTCTGRLFRYDIASKQISLVAENFCFGNGFQLSPDDKTVVISDTSRSRVLMISTATGKTTKTIPVPMLPDNIRLSRRGTYWVCGSNTVSFLGRLAVGVPALRQAAAGLFSKKLLRIGTPFMFNTNHGIVAEMDQNGKILRTLHDTSGKLIVGASQATELADGRLVIGSYFGPNAAIVTI